MSSIDSDESETHSTTHEESSQDHTAHSRGSAIVKQGSRGSRLQRPRAYSAPVRVGHFRVFPHSRCHERYRGGRAPPQSMVAVVEGHDSADDNYESMLQSQVLQLFDSLHSISVPSSSASSASAMSGNGAAADATAEKNSRHARSKSISARHKMGVLKEIAQQQAAAEAASGSKEDSRQNEATLKSLVDEFESVIDLAESLMTVEDLSWASLFHHRYMCSGRLMRLSELDHIKAVTECFLAACSGLEEDHSATRKQASKLMQYIVSHPSDPDNALVGLTPSDEIAQRLRTALDTVYGDNATHPEMRDKILCSATSGELSVVPSSQMTHGMLVIANLPMIGFKILRFSRMDPTRTHMIQLWTKSNQKETVALELFYGVFVFDDWMKSCLLSHDPYVMGKLVCNPLAPLHDEIAELLQKRVDTFLRANNLDMFLLGLSEADLISETLDLSAYDGSGAQKTSGQALCTLLLSLFDAEKKKLLQLRGNLNPSQVEDVSLEVTERVEVFMSRVNVREIFAPIKTQQIEAAYNLGLKCVAAFQQELDSRVVHLEVLIDYVICNWKKLSDAKLRTELRDAGGSTIRSRSMSRGSMKSFLSANKDKVDSNSPALSRTSKGAADVSTPQSKKKFNLSSIFKKE